MFFARLWWECDRRCLLVGPGSSHHSLYLFTFIGWICWTNNIKYNKHPTLLLPCGIRSHSTKFIYQWLQFQVLSSKSMDTADSKVLCSKMMDLADDNVFWSKQWIWKMVISCFQSGGCGRRQCLMFKSMDPTDGYVSWSMSMDAADGKVSCSKMIDLVDDNVLWSKRWIRQMVIYRFQSDGCGRWQCLTFKVMDPSDGYVSWVVYVGCVIGGLAILWPLLAWRHSYHGLYILFIRIEFFFYKNQIFFL